MSAEVVATVGMVVTGVAVIANAVVLLVLVRARRQFGSSVHTLITNQSAMDLYTSLSVIPIHIMTVTHGFNYGSNQILDGAICVIFEGGTPMVVGLTAEKIGLVVITLERYFKVVIGISIGIGTKKIGFVVITLERYFKIVHAIAHRKYYRNWMTKVGVVLPWIVGVCLILFPAMGTTRIVNGQCLRMGVWPNKAMAMVCLHVWPDVFLMCLYC